MSEIVPVMDRLRLETRDQHLQVEALPFFDALQTKDLPLASYAGMLRAFCIVYEVFEHMMSRAQHPKLNAVWDDSLRKLPLIDRDIAYFQSRGLPDAPVALLRAHLLTQHVRHRAHDVPVSLLGYLYVLEGSTLGGIVLKDQIARTLKLSDSEGLAYISSYGKQTKARWKEFGARMNSTVDDLAEQDQVVAAAQEAFRGIGHIIDALYPFEAHPTGDLVRTLNPAAGSHAIPLDARELQAALRAGERTWRKFPYYEWRYGERGQQFTRSDSGWLVTLSAHESVVVNQQIRWLGRVLASRGMPQWMLELHLDVLHEELVASIPENHALYTRLRDAAEELRQMRRKSISDQVLAALVAQFDHQVGSEWSARLPLTGGLLAAAVADEQAGISRAVTSIESWLTDPSRFPSQWIEAVQLTIQAARQHALASDEGA